MSSTEQKNINQPFISHCFTYGILPTILTQKFDNFGLDTDRQPFDNLGETQNLGKRLRGAANPIEEARRLFPVLRNARPATRVSPFILGLCSNSKVYTGNQAIMRFAEGYVSGRWGVFISETPAVRHARNHSNHIHSLFAPGSYLQPSRSYRNAKRTGYSEEGYKYRIAADAVDYLAHGLGASKHGLAIRRWCTNNRDDAGFRSSYRKESDAVRDYRDANDREFEFSDGIPEYSQSIFRTLKASRYRLSIYRFGDHTYVRVWRKPFRFRIDDAEEKVKSPNGRKYSTVTSNSGYSSGEDGGDVYVFSKRDLDDLRYILHGCCLIRSYTHRRRYDGKGAVEKARIEKISATMWSLYTEVMRYCGSKWSLRNKLGVYFDVLQWRYLAWKSGDEFYNHSFIMSQKIKSKDLEELPDQSYALSRLKTVGMDVAVDSLGIYKASIYPEVDPFKVVADQYKLHYSRFDTNWEVGSEEWVRFNETKAYMWYFGIRVLKKRMGIWPGKVRKGVEKKTWHDRYKSEGIPGDRWREARDIDLTATVPVSDISNEQYMKQADSACAPPLRSEYRDYDSMRSAPRKHRRKVLYAIQEPVLPDLPSSLSQLNRIGSNLPDGYVGKVDATFDFSTDIVTGSRCERHKDAPRPFYAASPPWGCILSYVDGITRDFLNNVPQSMLGKSTRQKFLDISTTSKHEIPGTQSFFMSDDKAKYSPRMDPNSQQMPADFFAELFDIPGIKAIGPIMYHNDLYYRVSGHLVRYNSNGTDREGMRGASNTWLEIVAQGLATRLSRDKGLIIGKSIFLSFIDDGLRKFAVKSKGRNESEVRLTAIKVIDEVVFGLKVLGRELSWDKTFISRKLFVILNELMYDNSHISSGLKSYVTAGDIEVKEVMSAVDYEQLYFGKMRGAHGVGAPLDLCHLTYIFETLLSHYKMGVNLQDNHNVNNLEYRLFCITPVALGGGGLRSMLQLGCNEVASATKEGIGIITRLGKNIELLSYCVNSILNQPLEQLSPVDFMREPEQFHVSGPRLKSQRVAAEVRKKLGNIASNDMSRSYVMQDREGIDMLASMGKAILMMGDTSAEDVRLLYSMTPIVFIDEFIQKLASSTTLSALLGQSSLSSLRRFVKRDLINAVNHFRVRCDAETLIKAAGKNYSLLETLSLYMSQ